MSHSSVFLVFKWSWSNESTGSSQHVIPWDCIELRFSNIKKKSASKTEFQTFAFFVNLNWVIVARCSESLIKIITTKGSQHVYWSVPAALLVRFRGDALGEALSETQEVKIKYSEIKITVRKQNKAEGEWSSVIITAGQNELTHGIKSLLRNPADVHIIYSSSALFYFHRKPLFLQNTHKDRKTTLCHVKSNLFTIMLTLPETFLHIYTDLQRCASFHLIGRQNILR